MTDFTGVRIMRWRGLGASTFHVENDHCSTPENDCREHPCEWTGYVMQKVESGDN